MFKMKAAILENTGMPLVLADDVGLPELQEHQVLVKVRYTGICQSQLMEIDGNRGPDPYLPHLLGHEACGEVIEIGKGIKKVSVGNKVVLTWIKSEGLDGPPPKYSWRGKTLNAGAITTFNEFAIVSENRLVPYDPNLIPDHYAWLLGCAMPTGAGMVLNTAKPGRDQTIAIFGLGGIGLSCLLGALVLGVQKIIAVDVNEGKLSIAKELGAQFCINASTQDPVETIKEYTGGLGVDYAFEASGISRVIEQAFESTRRSGGKCIFASHPKSGSKVCIDPFELICGKCLEGSWGGGTKPDRDFPTYSDMYCNGKLPLEKLNPSRYKFDDINEAIKDLKNGRVQRAFIDMETL